MSVVEKIRKIKHYLHSPYTTEVAMGFLDNLDHILRAFLRIKEDWLERLLRPTPQWLTANELSGARIVFAAFTIIFILTGRLLVGAILYVVGALLDLFDGPLARLRNKETDKGKFLDVFADKILGGFSLIAVFTTLTHVLPALLFALSIGADLIVVVLWLIGKTMPVQSGWRRRLGANNWGKWKFFFQSVAIPLFLLGWTGTARTLLWIALPFAILSIAGHLGFRNAK